MYRGISCVYLGAGIDLSQGVRSRYRMRSELSFPDSFVLFSVRCGLVVIVVGEVTENLGESNLVAPDFALRGHSLSIVFDSMAARFCLDSRQISICWVSLERCYGSAHAGLCARIRIRSDYVGLFGVVSARWIVLLRNRPVIGD